MNNQFYSIKNVESINYLPKVETPTNIQNIKLPQVQNEANNTKKLPLDLTVQVNNALSNNKSKSKTYLGKVNEYVANRIKKITGIDVRNRKHVLTDNDIRHIVNQHGNQEVETTKGQIAVTVEDIKNIPDIINNPTEITKGNDNKLRQTIRYIKEYNDNSTYVVEVVPDSSNALIIKTMWKKPSTLTNSITAPSLTSETQGSDISSTTDDSITQPKENVNPTTNYPMQNDFNTYDSNKYGYLDENFKPTGTRTNMQELLLPEKEKINVP